MSGLFGRDFYLLVALVVVGAAALVVHLLALRCVLGAASSRVAKALATLLPPATPVVAFRSGYRKTAIAWGVIVASYVVLRVLA